MKKIYRLKHQEGGYVSPRSARSRGIHTSCTGLFLTLDSEEEAYNIRDTAFLECSIVAMTIEEISPPINVKDN